MTVRGLKKLGVFFFQAEDGIRDLTVTGVQTCALPILITKILAAKRAAGSGASTVIAWGREQDVLVRLAAGESIGTLLVAQTHKNQARKQWIADHLQLRGSVSVDAGAVAKLRDEGKKIGRASCRERV